MRTFKTFLHEETTNYCKNLNKTAYTCRSGCNSKFDSETGRVYKDKVRVGDVCPYETGENCPCYKD